MNKKNKTNKNNNVYDKSFIRNTAKFDKKQTKRAGSAFRYYALN